MISRLCYIVGAFRGRSNKFARSEHFTNFNESGDEFTIQNGPLVRSIALRPLPQLRLPSGEVFCLEPNQYVSPWRYRKATRAIRKNPPAVELVSLADIARWRRSVHFTK